MNHIAKLMKQTLIALLMILSIIVITQVDSEKQEERIVNFKDFEKYIKDFENTGDEYEKLSKEILQELETDLLKPQEKAKIRKTLGLESGKTYTQLVHNIDIAEEALKIVVNHRKQLKQKVRKANIDELGVVIADFFDDFDPKIVPKLLKLIKLEIIDDKNEYLDNSFKLALKVDGNIRCLLVHYYIDKRTSKLLLPTLEKIIVELIHIDFNFLEKLAEDL